MRAGDESFERLRAAIQEMAADDVPELLLEARAEARARVRSMLSEAIAQSMLEHARERLETPAGPPAARPPAPSPTSMEPKAEGELALYVYGVTYAGVAVHGAAPGIDPLHGITSIEHDGLSAVVSRVSLRDFDEEPLRERLADMEWLERTARGHDAVLDAVRLRRTVVPMRLCSIYREVSGVRAMLEREADTLRRTLQRLDGRAEYGVKVFSVAPGDSDPRFDGGPARTPDDAGDGTMYMESRRRAHSRRRDGGRRLEEACRVIHERLFATAADGLTVAPQRPEVSGHPGEMIMNGVYLVDDDRHETFAGVVGQLQSELGPIGLELQLTGPWPAYNFLDGAIGAAW